MVIVVTDHTSTFTESKFDAMPVGIINSSEGWWPSPLLIIQRLLLLNFVCGLNVMPLFLGITNDTKDPSVDTFRMVTLHMLKHFGVPLEGLELKIESRGAPPHGGGEVLLRVPNINSTLKVCWSLLLLTSRDFCWHSPSNIKCFRRQSIGLMKAW